MENEVNKLNETPFYLGNWYIEPSLGRISGQLLGSGSIKLEPQVMAVLLCLIKQQGQVVSRETIEDQAWGNRVVGYDSLSTAIIKLRKAFGDDSKNPQYIETVPKKGYRLIMPVTSAKPDKTNSQNKTKPRQKRLQSGLIISIVIISLAFMLYNKAPYLFMSPEIIQHNTIAVLPFKNMSGDIQQEYFSDGITADLITDLSKLSGLGVIARNSVFAYKESAIDVRQIGKELSVRYIVEGSVRKNNDLVRISARLIDASTGHNLWAERFDGKLRNVFTLQDTVTAKIIAALQLKLSDSEQQQLSRKYTNSFTAYDHFLQGWQLFWEYSKESNALAKVHFKNAIELDPKFARAYANLALSYAYDVLNGWTSTPEDNLKHAKALSQKAIKLDDELAQVHWAVGFTALISREYQFALTESQKIIALDPNNADGYGLLATTLNYAAKPRDALVYMKKAMQLNPLHPFVYKLIMGEIYFNLHDYKNAVKQFEHALERNPSTQESRIWLAASYAQLGRLDDASWQLDHIRNDDPDFSITNIETVIPFRDPMQLKHLIDGLHKAGLK